MSDGHDGPMVVSAAEPPAAEQESLGATLERSRLAHRARRVEMVLAQLGERRRERTGPVPMALDQAIDGFAHELAQVRAELSASKLREAAERRVGTSRRSLTGSAGS